MLKERRYRLSYILEAVISLVGGGVILFGAAGKITWWPAWGVLMVNAGMMAAMGLAIFRRFPDLAQERLKPPGDSKKWDKAINSVYRLIQLARYVAAGLDYRNGWTTGFPAALPWVGFIVSTLGYAIIPWAVANNKFFSQIVRIQKDRGHAVAAGGPYRFVRHPGYFGMIAFELGIPLLLGSWPALWISAGNAMLIVLRTALEDRTLRAELPGYAEYAQRVKCRLVPGIW